MAYAFSMADKMLPFRKLLKPNTPFQWTEELHGLFEKSKRVIASEIEDGVRILTLQTTDSLRKHANAIYCDISQL